MYDVSQALTTLYISAVGVVGMMEIPPMSLPISRPRYHPPQVIVVPNNRQLLSVY